MEPWDSFLTFPNESTLLEPFGLTGVAAGDVDDFPVLGLASVPDIKIDSKAPHTASEVIRLPAKKKRRVGRSKLPKKPRTGYNYFHLHEREGMMRRLAAQGFQADKEALNAEANRRIAQKWRTMGLGEKRAYLEKAEEDKVRYERELSKYTQSSSSSAGGEMTSRCLPGTLDDLKELAEKLGIKKARVGWAVCCPPSGTKTDIRRAVANHMKLQPASQTQLPTMPSGPTLKTALNININPNPPATRLLDRAGTPTLLATTGQGGEGEDIAIAAASPVLNSFQPSSAGGARRHPVPLVPAIPAEKALAKVAGADAKAAGATRNLMSMRTTLGSRTWLLDLARRHNLLSEKSKPFLKDAMDAIEKELSLTMTRMSKRVLSIVANNANITPTTNVHKLIKQFNKLQRDFEVSKDLVTMVNAVSVNDISRPQSLVRLTTGTVRGFFMLNKPLCDLLISEAKRCAKHCELKFGQISVETLGLQEAMTKLALKSILPALGLDTSVDYEVDGSVIYDGDKPLSNDFTFTADPADDWNITGSERSLPYHMDDSVITINMCLGDKFTGGSILFENVAEVEHQICRGIVHPGNMRHKVTPCKGQRFNLLLFLNKKA